jgi:hypothetical protein
MRPSLSLCKKNVSILINFSSVALWCIRLGVFFYTISIVYFVVIRKHTTVRKSKENVSFLEELGENGSLNK